MSTAAVVNLKAERLNRGYSLRQAAEAIGVPEQSIRRAERDEPITPRNAFLIAKHYGYQVTDVWPLEPNGDAPTGATTA